MPKFGGGGASCTICAKTVYPAETVQFEKKPYHIECFRCSECDKKMEGPGNASAYEEKIYCKHCFAKGGFAQKQRNTTWTKKEGGSAVASKFGGGGNPCEVCAKTVYPAETVSYEKKVYHAECFQCSNCSKKMVPSGAAQFEQDGKNLLFCSKCFSDGGYSRKQAAQHKVGGTSATSSGISSKFGGGGNPCTACDKTVYPAESMSFEKRVYHAECFKCKVCDKKMTPSGAAQFEEDGVKNVYCTKCFQEGGYTRKQAATAKGVSGSGGNSAIASKFGGGGTKCYRCQKTVYPAETVSFEKQSFHQDCFTCLNCDKKCSTSEAEGKKIEGGVDVYCRKCWRELGLGRA